jgi:tetratricopeptide (TPR) repeat protein
MRRFLSFELVLGLMVGISVFGAARPGLALAPQKPAVAALAQAPLSEKETIDLIKHNKKDLTKVAPILQSRGVDFEVTPEIEKKLQKAGATEEFIATIKNLTPSARAAASKTPGGAPAVSPQETRDFAAVENELDPDRQIQLAQAFEKNYPTSPMMTFIYSFEANAYQQKNDAPRTADLAEKSLKLKPDNLLSLMIASAILPTPQMVGNLSDAQKAKRLGEAEQDANRALQIIDQLPKQPRETDEAYKKRKAMVSSGVYSSLGMVHLERAEMGLQGPDMTELAKAEEDYSTAVQNAQTPNAADYYRLGEVLSTEGKLDGAIVAFTKASNAAQGSTIQTLAQQEIKKLNKRKAAAGSSKKQ